MVGAVVRRVLLQQQKKPKLLFSPTPQPSHEGGEAERQKKLPGSIIIVSARCQFRDSRRSKTKKEQFVQKLGKVPSCQLFRFVESFGWFLPFRNPYLCIAFSFFSCRNWKGVVSGQDQVDVAPHSTHILSEKTLSKSERENTVKRNHLFYLQEP